MSVEGVLGAGVCSAFTVLGYLLGKAHERERCFAIAKRSHTSFPLSEGAARTACWSIARFIDLKRSDAWLAQTRRDEGPK